MVCTLQGVPALDAQRLALLHERLGTAGRFPSLYVQAEKDLLFDSASAESFVQDFGSELLLCRKQAHCFLDAGWEDSYARPVGKWLVERDVT